MVITNGDYNVFDDLFRAAFHHLRHPTDLPSDRMSDNGDNYDEVHDFLYHVAKIDSDSFVWHYVVASLLLGSPHPSAYRDPQENS